jgi:multisubunit Na+/H+ antiporter MnhF subunit
VDREDLEMTGLLIAAIVLVVLAIALLYRIFRGPTAADRIAALDALDLILAMGLAMYSLYTGRGIYLDIALVVALLGFVGTVFVGRYMEGRM